MPRTRARSVSKSTRPIAETGEEKYGGEKQKKREKGTSGLEGGCENPLPQGDAQSGSRPQTLP